MLAANWPLLPSCLQNRITNLVETWKKNIALLSTCISRENDASGYHCKPEPASPDPLFALRIPQGERFDFTMLISFGSTLKRFSHQQEEKHVPNFHFEEKCMYRSPKRNLAQF